MGRNVHIRPFDEVRMRRLTPAILLPILFATALAAQAPVITPAGDPSVSADTIYRLAVDPSAYPEEASVLLLDDGVARFEADGRSHRTFRQVVQILRPEAVEEYQEFSFSYAPGHERMVINWIRVVRPDGTVISAKPTFEQDSDVPAQMGDPIYSDRRVRRLSITGVAPGTIVDWSYTTEDLKPFLPGDFLQSWGVTTALPVMRSRLIVEVPAGLEVRLRESNLDFPRRTETRGGRTVHTWATRDVAKAESEPYLPDSNPVWMSVLVGSPMTWEGIASWYAGNARGRDRPTAAVRAKVAELVAGARTRADSIRRIHRWVAQDIRYVSIALGLGGYQPRTPDETIETGYGDCKDKATLFVAALRAIGVEAYPVLLAMNGGVVRALPSISQLDHAIAAVRTPTGYTFTDLTSAFTPYGELPPSEEGEFGLVVLDEKRSEVVTLPEFPVEANVAFQKLEGEVSGEGLVTARFEEVRSGSSQYEFRSAFENPFDETTATEVAKTLARNFFPTARGDSLVISNGKDLETTPRVSVRIVDGRGTRKVGETDILHLPFGDMEQFAEMARSLAEGDPRRFPINVAAVTGDNVLRQELRLILPAGWRVQLPRTFTAKSAFGTYAVRYEQEGREFRLSRNFIGARGTQPADQMPELIRWLEEIGTDDAKYVVFER